MRNQPNPRGRTSAEAILTYAMVASLTSIVLITAGLLSIGAPPLGTLIGMTIVGGLWVFTITPHIVASWLDCSVDSLLGIRPDSGTHQSNTDSNDTGKMMPAAIPTER